jgi:hypothetical protein
VRKVILFWEQAASLYSSPVVSLTCAIGSNASMNF